MVNDARFVSNDYLNVCPDFGSVAVKPKETKGAMILGGGLVKVFYSSSFIRIWKLKER